ncbi:hypothetical protein Dimus_028655, partial [Dionaea muscipula]
FTSYAAITVPCMTCHVSDSHRHLTQSTLVCNREGNHSELLPCASLTAATTCWLKPACVPLRCVLLCASPLLHAVRPNAPLYASCCAAAMRQCYYCATCCLYGMCCYEQPGRCRYALPLPSLNTLLQA